MREEKTAESPGTLCTILLEVSGYDFVPGLLPETLAVH